MKTPRTPFRRLIAGAALAFALSCPVAQADEFRGFWVDAWGAGFLNASQVTTLVNHCRTYNFNAVVVQMRRNGDAFYTTNGLPGYDPRTTAPLSPANFDALQELINQCHAGSPRIEVHCWVKTHAVAGTAGTTQPGHIYVLHPEYLTETIGGVTLYGEGYWVDPGHPDVTQWNYNLAMDIASRYDIDGFHWDYIRYPTTDSGYNATAIARYNAEFGTSGEPPVSSTQFSNWRRRQVTDFLRWANADLLALKPNLVVSASVFASRSDAYNARYQDWAAWNNEGLHDLCLIMNYSADNAGVFNPRADDAFVNQGVRRVYVGQGAYLNTKENTVVQLDYVRTKGFLGHNFYSYRTPNSGTVDQIGTFTYVRDNHQPAWADVPSLPWKLSPTKGIVKGTITREDDGTPIYNATVTIATTPSRNQQTEPHGKYAFFETTPGTYNVSATAAGLGVGNGTAIVTAGGNVTVDIIVPTSDTSPPVISGVAAGAITDTSATITWSTDESSDSVVEYGTTTAYGSTASNPALVLSHSIGLSGLTGSTLYHYRVKSTDAANNTATSGDFTFTTLPSGVVADIIIDNPAATIVGTWSTGTTATDKYGTNYRYKSQGTGAAYLQYTPNILTAGDYDVYEWHTQGGNRATDTPHIITHSGGTTTIPVNQQINGGAWRWLNRFNFPTGMTKYVRITDGFSTAGLIALADAIKFVYVPATPPPAAPSDLAATAVSSSQIRLTWTDNSSNEDNFIISRSTVSGGPYTDIVTLAANITSFDDTGLDASTAYYYVARAANAGGESANSTEASATTLLSPPADPSGLTATTVSSSQISLAWTDNSSNEDSFIISRSTAAGGPYTDIATLPADTASFDDTGLDANTTYYYVARATNAAGSSANSNEASATTLPFPPADPGGLIATAVSSSQISLAWTDNSSNEDNFIISRSTATGGPYTDMATLPADTVSFDDTGLSASTTYYYVVRAANTGGASANSNEASATTLLAPPANPSDLIATAVSFSQIDLTWTDNSTDEDNFIISRSTVSGGPYTDIVALAADTTSYSDTGLAESTTYYYVVRAVNGGGSSPNSNEAGATTFSSQTTVTFTSVGAHDGWVQESGENTGVGGTLSATASTASALRTGDNSQDRQIKTIVSFDTSSLPDGATIISVTLKVKRGSVTGTSPFTTHGTCFADIKGGAGFGGALALAAGDFQATADATQVTTMSDAPTNGTWSTGVLNGAGLGFINKTGHTQFRVYHSLDDNDDLGNDYLGWYSGENATAGNRPVLEVVYQ